MPVRTKKPRRRLVLPSVLHAQVFDHGKWVDATPLRVDRSGKKVVVRLRTIHPRQESERVTREMTLLRERFNALDSKRGKSDAEYDEAKSLSNILLGQKSPRPAKITNTFAVSPTHIRERVVKPAIASRPSLVERREQQRVSILGQISRRLANGENPKRLQRELGEAGFGNVPIGDLAQVRWHNSNKGRRSRKLRLNRTKKKN